MVVDLILFYKSPLQMFTVFLYTNDTWENKNNVIRNNNRGYAVRESSVSSVTHKREWFHKFMWTS